jgi:hypothetical protein
VSGGSPFSNGGKRRNTMATIDYTPVQNAGARVITIEYIVGVSDDPNIEEVLDVARGSGSAAVVKDIIVAESYEDACAVLMKRAVPGYPY